MVAHLIPGISMHPFHFRFSIVAALACISLSAQASDAVPSNTVDLSAQVQKKSEVQLARVAMRQNRPDIACAALKPSTPPDSTNHERLLLLGRCSSALGNNEEAAAYYRRLIALMPNSAAPRVELARVYARMGRRESAAAMLDEAAARNGDGEGTALMKQLAERLRNNDPAVLASEQSKPWSLQVYTGVVYDDNVNAGPVSRNVPAVLGGIPVNFELVPEAMPRSSFGAALGLTGSYVVPLSGNWGLLWQASYFGTHYFSEQDFDNDSLALSGAFIYRDQNFSGSIQPNLRYTRLDGRLQESSPGITARAAQQITPEVALTGSLGYFDRSVPVDRDRDAQAWFGSIGLTWQASKNVQLGGEYLWQREDAKLDIYSRRANGPSVFVSWQASPTVSLIGNYSYSTASYDERMALFPDRRHDRQEIASATLLWDVSRWAGRNMVFRAQYSYIENPSNIAYNTFRRNITSVGVQTMF
jgi:tetratricopeptide (TPR) repeat protein